jgi:hypothetical protein
VDTIKSGIGQFEKTVNALVFLPRLIRREHWIAQIGTLLQHAGTEAQDWQRPHMVLDLPGNDSAERFVTASADEHNRSP